MPNIEPLISIIVPVYNSEKYLSRCIESILAQSFKNLEIILIDDVQDASIQVSAIPTQLAIHESK